MTNGAARPLALTLGEPGGIGPEITAKAWRTLRAGPQSEKPANRMADWPTFCLVGDLALMAAHGPAQAISSPLEAASVFPSAIPVIDCVDARRARPGTASPETAPAVIASIERAVALALSGEAAGVVTNPIQKSALQAAGFGFPGHTEFLGELTAGAPMPAGRTRGPVMMLAGPGLRTVPVTIHLSVADAARTLDAERIVHVASVAAEELGARFGIARPRLAVSGLNPHAGEDGRMGGEDGDVIAPAVARLRAAGIDAIGPMPADTMFHAAARAGYDAAICMLHDQALIPVKTLAFDEAVNVTLGLPIVRTSPDHGTALDIAGKGVASPASLIAALRLAARMATP
ncbi:MAG: 4-hydroxythreonine-4-phosphate dehydrogenase PdxA [Alphaproteobacteria bacterium]|nr:4-hydroxythreonine-4-phosphate dehydrogenase PdxA [Alphaproteobacteria bacterium]